MKRKAQPQEDRRRALAEINLIDEGKRMQIRRKGCLKRLAGLFALLTVIAPLAVHAITAVR